MKRADSKSTTTTRRNALAAIAAVAGAAGTVPALAAASQSHPDAELLSLRDQFRAHLPAELAARKDVARRARLVDKRLLKLFPEAPKSEEEYNRRMAALHALNAKTGRDEAYNVWHEQIAEIEPLAAAIKNAETTSLVGVAAKAEVLCWEACCNCATSEGIDFDQVDILGFVAGLFAAAGEPLPAEVAEEIDERARLFG